MSTELAVINPTELMRVATDVAGVCKQVVTKTAVQIGHKKYIPVEGWQTIATAHGCILSSTNIKRIADGPAGIVATGEVRRISDGAILATAEGFVGDEESTWGVREEYAKRAMAQTRAMSRAARSAFAHVVVLMDAGLETTPAAEVPHGGFTDDLRNVTPPKPPEPTKPTPTQGRPVSASRTAPPANGGKKAFTAISDKQAKRLFAIGVNDGGISGEELNRCMGQRYPYTVDGEGHTHINQLKPSDYEEACKWATAGCQDGPTEPQEAVDTATTGDNIPF